MKTIATMLITVCAVMFLESKTVAQSSNVSDTVVMGASYVDEVYYKFDDGTKFPSARQTWDIAFRTPKRSSSILTNDGSGVVLFTYPKSDTTGWASIDTTGLYTWKSMYNDPTDWENGAFSRNATGHPDYGWGKYNDVTHDVIGDSLFVIKLRDGSFKKLWIVKKYSSQDIYDFRFANLDGTGYQDIKIDLKADTAKNFIGYSLQTNEKIDFEPVRQTWDILFTKYMSVQPDGTPYTVTGVLCNQDVSTKRFEKVPLDYNDWGPGKWDSTRSSIGWNWKVFDMNTFTYKIVDSLVFFVKNVKGDIHKLYFTSYEGSATGVITFIKERVAGAGVENLNVSSITLKVYPNPASNFLTLNYTGKAGDDVFISLTDLSGRQLLSDRPGSLAEGSNSYRMDVSGITPGIYFVTVASSLSRSVLKVIISH